MKLDDFNVGNEASEYWTQVAIVSDKETNVYTMRAASVTTLIDTG